MAGIRFDNLMTTGNMITITTLAGLAVSGWTAFQARAEFQVDRIDTIEGTAALIDSRVRALEIMQAGQQSDLRNIQTGIDDIKVSLQRLTGAGARP